MTIWKHSLNEKQSYDAMLEFLKQYADERYGHGTTSDDVGELLYEIGYIQLDRRGVPFTNEPGSWSAWLKAVERALATGGSEP
jgi:hypothetical protein